jgi:hypothetical protein
VAIGLLFLPESRPSLRAEDRACPTGWRSSPIGPGQWALRLNFSRTEFSKVRRFLCALAHLVSWRTYIPLTPEYALLVAWTSDRRVVEVGSLPALILDGASYPTTRLTRNDGP